ncbi:MAG: hypothetical protein KDI90_11030 [Alphaproteobacteria bacterium]|nr:hypothetical protein [Alphaproteobacteria bacterium]MCB9974725.1 hypothetical protein [Rhodospirillales bacterium]
MSGSGDLRARIFCFFIVFTVLGAFSLVVMTTVVSLTTTPVLAQSKKAEEKNEKRAKIYYVPPSKIMSVIEKSKGRKRALFIWKSTNGTSIDFLPEFSTLEGAKPGSIISINVDKDPVRVSKFLNSIQEKYLRTFIVKPVTGESLDASLAAMSILPAQDYPLVVLLDENNGVREQGRLFIDYVADYILSNR